MKTEELHELDAQIAVRFFGWKWFREKKRGLDGIFPPDDGVQIRWNFMPSWYDEVSEGTNRYVDWADHLPRYSFDMNDTHRLLEELKRRRYTIEIRTVVGVRSDTPSDIWCARVMWLNDFEPVVVDGVGDVAGDLDKPWFWGAIDESLPVAICKAALLAEER